MAHIIPFRLPDPAKAPRKAPAADSQPATVTYLEALKRQPGGRA
ncbi:MAG: hypothetical protein AB7J28_11135 [Hyphomonadaceae bacterium]